MDDNEFLRKMGKRIAELRKEKGWTQEEFSEKLGIKRSALARIETGNVNTTVLRLKSIIQELGLDFGRILDN